MQKYLKFKLLEEELNQKLYAFKALIKKTSKPKNLPRLALTHIPTSRVV